MIDLKKLITLPHYTTRIPSTGKLVSFRPFVVKEEKIMLIAKQSENEEEINNCIKEILKNCYKEEIDFDDIPYFDTEYLFIQLRMKSMGEMVEIVVTDPKTKEKFDTQLNLEKIKVINLNKNKQTDIKLNDTLAVGLKYPAINNFFNLNNKDNKENVYDTVVNSIKAIYTKDQVLMAKDLQKSDLKEFVESLTSDMFLKILEFFEEMPKVIYEDEFISPSTGNKIPVKITNFMDFFR